MERFAIISNCANSWSLITSELVVTVKWLPILKVFQYLRKLVYILGIILQYLGHTSNLDVVHSSLWDPGWLICVLVVHYYQFMVLCIFRYLFLQMLHNLHLCKCKSLVDWNLADGWSIFVLVCLICSYSLTYFFPPSLDIVFYFCHLYLPVRRIWIKFCGHVRWHVLVCTAWHSWQELHCSSGCHWYYPTIFGLGSLLLMRLSC